MAETSKSFWCKFKKSKLKSIPFHRSLPSDLIEMFPSRDSAELYNIYSLKCDNSITKTVEYLTQNESSNNLYDEIPINILIESLNDSKIANSSSINNINQYKHNFFKSTPTHILSHIFSFNGPMTLGKITRLNRECRLLSKSLLSKIKIYDFSYYYHNYCQYKQRKRRNNNIGIILNDELKLISHINAFQYLEHLSLRSTYFSKWYCFKSILNKNNIKYLNLSSSINLYDDDIIIIIEQFPSLQIFDLSNCIEITDLAITHIIEYENTNNLHTIYLNHTPQITKYGIKQLIKYKKNIINLEWKGAKYGNITMCFEKSKHLKYLNLASNNCLEEIILTLENKNGSLHLNLSNCTKLRFLDLKITHLTSLNLTQCIKLREVRISNSINLKDVNCKSCKLLQLLAIPSKTVENVQLSGCNTLNLQLLFHENNFLMESLKNNKLKSLDISQIHHISNDDIDQILNINKEHNNPLKALSVYQCKLISNTKINSIHKIFEKPRIKSERVKKRKQRIMDRKNRKYTA